MVAAEGEILSRGAARARTTERMAARYQLHVDEKVLHNGLIAAEDMDLRSNCDQNLEYQETVKRMYTPAPIGRDPRELGITTLPEDIKHLEGVPETMPLMKRSLRHVRNMFQNFSFIVYLALAMCLIGPANGIHLNHTNQLLPKECLSWMKANGNDCPEREHPVDDDWKLLNAKCCHAFQGTFLHCQTHLNQYSMLACMKDQKVPVGYKSILVTDKAGDPEVQLKRCKNDSFSSVATNSSYNRLPYIAT
ncbi:uncharacterized protein [Littorina saxatilis]|uniref:uncharacterized protein n=1 Tax=Littorina saxatilis TaxID=31220 RepID=UPI0038B63A27